MVTEMVMEMEMEMGKEMDSGAPREVSLLPRALEMEMGHGDGLGCTSGAFVVTSGAGVVDGDGHRLDIWRVRRSIARRQNENDRDKKKQQPLHREKKIQSLQNVSTLFFKYIFNTIL